MAKKPRKCKPKLDAVQAALSAIEQATGEKLAVIRKPKKPRRQKPNP